MKKGNGLLILAGLPKPSKKGKKGPNMDDDEIILDDEEETDFEDEDDGEETDDIEMEDEIDMEEEEPVEEGQAIKALFEAIEYEDVEGFQYALETMFDEWYAKKQR